MAVLEGVVSVTLPESLHSSTQYQTNSLLALQMHVKKVPKVTVL